MNKDLYKSVHDVYTDQDGRLIILDLLVDEYTITIVALYAPNIDNVTFF